MNTSFSHALRVYICASCGAANHVAPDGGRVSCDTCTEQLDLAPRVEDDVQSSHLSEEERVDVLLQQDDSPLQMPADIAALTDQGMLSTASADQAMARWQIARRAVAAGEGAEVETRLYFLTRLLYEHMLAQGDDIQMRGLIETALDTSRSTRYRQVFRCMLACEAARVGDLTGADDWLAPCDPSSSDIHTDSVYRYSAAYVATFKRQYGRVLKVLGTTSDTPMAESFDAITSVLRANALERQGSIEAAELELSDAMSRVEGGVVSIERIVRNTANLALCRRSFIAAKAHARQPASEPPRERISDRPPSLPPVGRAGPPSLPPAARVSSRPPPPRRPPPPAADARSQLLKAAPWLVLSLLFLALAAVSGGAASDGRRLDLFFLVMGGAFAIPVLVMAFRSNQRQ